MSTTEYIKLRLKSIDWIIVLTVLVLVMIGLMAIRSAIAENESALIQKNFQRQIIWGLIGIVAMMVISMLSFRWLYAVAYILLLGGVFLLILTYIPGITGAGPRRWIPLGVMNFQPSEFIKIFLIIALARMLTDNIKSLAKAQKLLIPSLVTGIVTIIVLRQPDLGTAMVYPAVLFPMLFWAGVPFFTLFSIIAPFISLLSAMSFFTFVPWIGILLFILWISRKSLTVIIITFLINVSVGMVTPVMWNNMKPYQQQRIMTYVNSKLDPKGSGYQVLQSVTAIGSGGIYGKGLGDGTQTQLKFLPEQHTDFIFSLIGEELGFIGVIIILSLFILLIIRIIRISYCSKNVFESLLLIGIASVILVQAFINIGMTTGLVPVTGLPLPFISYGGSSLLSMMILVGLVLSASVEMKR